MSAASWWRNNVFSRRRSYEECLEHAMYFKSYVEDNDGYKILNSRGRAPFTEKEVQLVFGLVWYRSAFDINREPNNGRGPVDFKASFGSADKCLIEFKLATNTRLDHGLQEQISIYEKANRTARSVKIIVCYTAEDEARVQRTLQGLGIENDESIVVIDARRDNKPSATRSGREMILP